MLNENTYLHVGIDFIDSDGKRVTSIQLVDRNRGAIAIASFDNEKISKLDCLNEVDKTKFLDQAEELLNNSIPVTFTKQPKQLEIGPL